MDNLQLVVRAVHVRYEDGDTVPGHPFVAGVMINGFNMVATDSAGQIRC